MEHYYNREAEIEYKKTKRKMLFTLYAFIFLFCLAPLPLVYILPFEIKINLLIYAAIVFGGMFPSVFLTFKLFAKKIIALRKEAYGEDVELTSSNPIFEEIIHDYHSTQTFLNSILPKPWKKVESDDHWGIIFITFKKGKNTIDLKLSDTQITVIFNKENEAVKYTQPLENFPNCVELSDYIHKLQKDHFSK